jgi:pSer/pThr/pTyr-binding forkhead associated (FHA) protein
VKKLILEDFQSFSWLEESTEIEHSVDTLHVNFCKTTQKFAELDRWMGIEEFLLSLAATRTFVEIVIPKRWKEQLTELCQILHTQGLTLLGIQEAAEVPNNVGVWLKFRLDDQDPYSEKPIWLRRNRDARIWPLKLQQSYVLGRSRDSDIVLESMHASAQHCSIKFTRRSVGLVDLHSASGTYLNNRRVRRAFVDDYGLICLGRKETGHYLEMELRVPEGSAAYLHVISGANAGRVLPLLRPVTVIGRDPSCDQRILAPYISRAHIRFTLFENNHLIEDHASANGTRINERPIATDRIVHGDVLEAAGERFEVLGARSPKEVPTTNARLRIGQEEYSLNKRVVTIGSHESCDIALAESGLSRLQARFVWEGRTGGLKLYNLGGVAIMTVNKVRVGDTVLSSGDYIDFGDIQTQLLGSVGSGSKQKEPSIA